MTNITTSTINSLNPHNPPLRNISLGEVFNFHTVNSFNSEFKNISEFEKYLKLPLKKHPVTGPFFIKNIPKGNSICVVIKSIQVTGNSYQCISFSTGTLPGFGQNRNCHIYPKSLKINVGGLKSQISPSIGFIATTPQNEISCGRAGSFGGNLDFPFLGKGYKIHLPTYVEGALLAIGDVHSLLGMGEISGTGAEVSSEITLKVILSPFMLKYPLIEDDKFYYIAGYGNDLLESLKDATINSIDFLSKTRQVSSPDAYLFLGLSGNIVLGNSTGKIKTAAIKISKKNVKT